jgi:hypothetical protein
MCEPWIDNNCTPNCSNIIKLQTHHGTRAELGVEGGDHLAQNNDPFLYILQLFYHL